MKMASGSIVVLAATMASPMASASVVLHGTRVVYPSDARDVTIAVENEGPLPVLVQSWLDDGDPKSNPDSTDVPIILTPPLFRLDSHRTQSLRLIKTATALASDRETLFWLNVLEVPPLEKRQAVEPLNKLQLILRTRIKVFFRPKELKGQAREAPAMVQWTVVHQPDGGAVLRATNPTPFHANFSRIAPRIGERSYPIEEGGMIAPGESRDFALVGLPAGTGALNNVDFDFIDDFGAIVPGRFGVERSQ